MLALLDGSVRVASAGGERRVPAAEFFLGPLESAVQPGELALEASFPGAAPRAGTAFVEVARRKGDYAVCGVGAVVELDDDGALRSARTAYLSVAPTPLVLDLTDALGPTAGLRGGRRSGTRRRSIPRPTSTRPRDYRRHLAGVLTERRRCAAAHRAARAAERSWLRSELFDVRIDGERGTHDASGYPPAGCCRTACATTCA